MQEFDLLVIGGGINGAGVRPLYDDGKSDSSAVTRDYTLRLDDAELHGVFRRHGALAAEVLGDGDLGEHYGGGLYEREVRHFVERKWAAGADDVLWRRGKAGLQMPPGERERLAERLGR